MSVGACVSCGWLCGCFVCCKECPYIFGVGRCPAFFAFAMVQWLLSVWRFECIVVVGMRLLSFSLDCVVSLCVSWVARVNGGVASGLGGALVLSRGCGSNIVPFLTHFARRAEGVLGMLDLEL